MNRRFISIPDIALNFEMELLGWTAAEYMEQMATHLNRRNILLRIAYDGTDYFGWQIQPRRRTIQGTIAEALERICGEEVDLAGSGRTDAGVHAIEQTANVRLLSPIPCANLVAALNNTLPADIRILSAQSVPEGFHARQSAVSKIYRYRIFRPSICPPAITRFVLSYPYPLNVDAMARAAQFFTGTHDFRSFAASRSIGDLVADGLNETSVTAVNVSAKPKSCVRTIFSSNLRTDGDEVVYTVSGSGFLQHMVRNIVGTLIDIGRERIAPEMVSNIIAAKNRSVAGPTALARGLHLVSVSYPPEMLNPVEANHAPDTIS